MLTIYNHKWLLKKFKGSRKQQLVKDKTKCIHNRTRWTARLKEGDKELFVYQWLPSPIELRRSRYRQKGRDGFVHPYLANDALNEDHPQGLKEVDPSIFHISLASGKRDTPADMNERLTRVKIRDEFRCVKCGSYERIRVHHKRGLKSHRMKDLETLCFKCHHLKHGYQCREKKI